MNDMNATIARLERARSGKIILWTLLFLGGVVMITPIVFMASTSFKTGQELHVHPAGIEIPALDAEFPVGRHLQYGVRAVF